MGRDKSTKKAKKGDEKKAGGGATARPHRPIATNRQARFEYELLDRFEAGISLTGSEVKSCRAGSVSLRDAHVRVEDDECWLVGANVAPYEHATHVQHDPLRRRKLLLKPSEIARLAKATHVKGLTIVPTRVYFAGSWVKVEIALARGKKQHDKRETIKKRELDRKARAAVDR